MYSSLYKCTLLFGSRTVWVDKAVMLSLTRCVLAKKNGTGRHMELTDMNVSDRTYIFPFSVDEKYYSFNLWS